jgi:hypothetical protein
MDSRKWKLCAELFVLLCLVFPALCQAQDPSAALPTFLVPDAGNKLKIIAYGDMRITDPADNSHTSVIVRRALIDKIGQEKPSALLVSGDIPFRGANDEDWRVVDKELKPLWDAKLRIYPALGNHEFLGGNDGRALRNWWKRFPDLDGKRWYSVLFGNCYFIVLDSDSVLKPGKGQDEWLDAQLDHLPVEVDFVFVMLHHPSYTDSHDSFLGGGHSARKQEKRLAERLEELQPKTRARIIEVAGHVHNYERFEHAGVTYVVSGGGGATPYFFDRSPFDKYQGGNSVTYNYVRFDIDGTHLKATMMRLDASVPEHTRFEERDTFTLDTAPLKTPAITGKPAAR